MAKREINALIPYCEDRVKQPLLNLGRAANLKVNVRIFMEVFVRETRGNGSPPAQDA